MALPTNQANWLLIKSEYHHVASCPGRLGALSWQLDGLTWILALLLIGCGNLGKLFASLCSSSLKSEGNNNTHPIQLFGGLNNFKCRKYSVQLLVQCKGSINCSFSLSPDITNTVLMQWQKVCPGHCATEGSSEPGKAALNHRELWGGLRGDY